MSINSTTKSLRSHLFGVATKQRRIAALCKYNWIFKNTTSYRFLRFRDNNYAHKPLLHLVLTSRRSGSAPGLDHGLLPHVFNNFFNLTSDRHSKSNKKPNTLLLYFLINKALPSDHSRDHSVALPVRKTREKKEVYRRDIKSAFVYLKTLSWVWMITVGIFSWLVAYWTVSL